MLVSSSTAKCACFSSQARLVSWTEKQPKGFKLGKCLTGDPWKQLIWEENIDAAESWRRNMFGLIFYGTPEKEQKKQQHGTVTGSWGPVSWPWRLFQHRRAGKLWMIRRWLFVTGTQPALGTFSRLTFLTDTTGIPVSIPLSCLLGWEVISKKSQQ